MHCSNINDILPAPLYSTVTVQGSGDSVIVVSAGETALLGSSSLVITNNTVSCAELVISGLSDNTLTSLSVSRQHQHHQIVILPSLPSFSTL